MCLDNNDIEILEKFFNGDYLKKFISTSQKLRFFRWDYCDIGNLSKIAYADSRCCIECHNNGNCTRIS